MRTVIAVVVLLMFCAGVRAQPPTEDTSANSVFLNCKAFVEDRTPNAQLNAGANFCSGVVHGLASVGKYLSLQNGNPAFQRLPTHDSWHGSL